MRLWFALALAVVSAVPSRAQSPPPSGQPDSQIDSQPDSQIQTLTSQSALVVVPALVRTSSLLDRVGQAERQPQGLTAWDSRAAVAQSAGVKLVAPALQTRAQ